MIKYEFINQGGKDLTKETIRLLRRTATQIEDGEMAVVELRLQHDHDRLYGDPFPQPRPTGITLEVKLRHLKSCIKEIGGSEAPDSPPSLPSP